MANRILAYCGDLMVDACRGESWVCGLWDELHVIFIFIFRLLRSIIDGRGEVGVAGGLPDARSRLGLEFLCWRDYDGLVGWWERGMDLGGLTGFSFQKYMSHDRVQITSLSLES